MATPSALGHSRHDSGFVAQPPRAEATLVLADLLRERAAIEPIRTAVPQLWNLLEAEIARVSAAAADEKTAATLSSLASGLSRAVPAFINGRRETDPHSLMSQQPMPKRRVKIPVPAEQYPDFNFVGRLLGPRGTTLKSLERDTGCKIMIRGKGSIRKDKEPEVRGKPGWEHVFNEALHVVIEVGDAVDDSAATVALEHAKAAVNVLLVPVPEEKDGLKRTQLRTLAIMNGTYRGGGNPSRSIDGGLIPSLLSSPTHPVNYGIDPPNTPLYLGESMGGSAIGSGVSLSSASARVGPSVSHQLLPTFDTPSHDEQPSMFRSLSQQYNRYNFGFDRKPLRSAPGPQSPSSGGTSPKAEAELRNSQVSSLSAKMKQCNVDEFGSSSVGDDSPESSHSSEDSDPSGHGPGNLKVSSMSPGGRSETLVGAGGFLGNEFYNGAFSNVCSSGAAWDGSIHHRASSGLYSFSPVPSPQVLTSSTTSVTSIERQDNY